MEIDNNNNQDSDSDDPTLELEPLSEAACNKMMQADDAPAEPDAVAETEESHEICFETSAPVSDDTASEIQELRDELKYRVDINSILRHGNDQVRERCDRLAEQVSSLLKTNETLSNELERSRQQVMRTKQQLAEARDTEQALLKNLKKLDKEDAADAVIKKQDGAIEDLRRENLELTETVSDPEAKLARQEAEQRRSSGARRTSPTRSPSTGLAPGSEVQDCLVLLGANGVDSDTWVLDDGINTIGSSPDCDIRIQSKFVSRHHAQLIKTQNGSILEDLNSTNGTYINSRRINKRAMRAGDLVTIGKHRLRYRERSDHLVMTDLSKFGSGLQSG